MDTIYANVMNFRITPAELVLEFGSYFPDRPNTPPPPDFKPDVRIILNAGALDGLAQALTKMAEMRHGAAPKPKIAPGFGPSESK